MQYSCKVRRTCSWHSCTWLRFLRVRTSAKRNIERVKIRVLKWSRVSRETRLKIGLAISRDLKCKTCKTQKLAKIMHLGRFREGNKAIPHLAGFLWQPKNYVGWKSCYVSHSITCPHSPTLKLPSCVANLLILFSVKLNFHGLASLASLARH